MTCPDTDTLVTIAEAANWRISDFLNHLRSCEACEANLIELADTRSMLHHTEQPDANFVDAVIQDVIQARDRQERVVSILTGTAIPFLSGVTAFFVAASGHASLAASGIAAALVAAGALLWSLRTPSTPVMAEP